LPASLGQAWSRLSSSIRRGELTALVPFDRASGYLAEMVKKNSKTAAKGDDPNERLIAQNRKARHNFEVVDTLECGIMLVGSEVKSMRSGHVSIEEAYGRMDRGEVWLIGCDIPEYKNANAWNHEPKRRRKLLLHRREISKFASVAYEKNFTLVPLKMYFKEGRAKVLLGICRGKKNYDKRESIKKSDMQRDIDRAMRRG
jgi:SsrA-binding protein